MRTWLLLSAIILCLFVRPVYAKYDPLKISNNKFGIHIVDVNDMADAANLVNSTGGDWGYVTLVIQEDDRNFDKWQSVFNEMRKLHLIPIVRLATHVEGTAWNIPSKESGEDWARFLNSLNWPIENRYVILFNEPNHANEWGGIVDPEGFADIIQLFTNTLHDTSQDFFVMPGALDVSASSDGNALDAFEYWSRMIAHDSLVFQNIDGWASHSYPNPGFSGSPYATGRGSLFSFLWEKNMFGKFNILNNIPIFITETGWIHSQGVTPNIFLLSPDQVGNNLIIASNTVWQDPSIVAITPFVLNYQAYPFDHFSWKMLNSSHYYPQYTSYQTIEKNTAVPKQRESFTFKNSLVPHTLVANSSYTITDILTNKGQSIASTQEGYAFRLLSQGIIKSVHDALPVLEPNQSGTISMHIETSTTVSSYPYTLELVHADQTSMIESGVIQLVPPPSVTAKTILGWRTINDTTNTTILIYDDKTLLHKFNGVTVSKGSTTVKGLRNVVPGKSYRIVLLVPYYLPQQMITKLSAGTTLVSLPRMYPLDFDLDGKLSLNDIFAAVKLKPNFLFSLFIGP